MTYVDVNNVTHTLSNSSSPVISGRGEVGATIDVFDRDSPLVNPASTIPIDQCFTKIGTAVVSGDGTYTIALSSPLTSGLHNIGVTATDVAGNYSAGAPLSFEVDTVAMAPVLNSLDTNTSSTADGAAAIGDVVFTNDSTPTLTGYAEPGSVVSITDGVGNLLGKTTANGPIVNGRSQFTFEVDNPHALSQGLHTFKFTAIDPAGNLSATTPLIIGVDSVTLVPTVLLANTVTAGSTEYTNDNTPTLTGIAEAGATVAFTDQWGNILGSVTAESNGAYSFTPTTALSEGAKTITATATDAVGNTQTSTHQVTIDTQTADPTVGVDAPGLTVGGVIYDKDSTPTITGVAEAGSTVTFKDGSKLLGTTVADADGNYSFTPSDVNALSDGVHALSVSVTDIAGNVSNTVTQSITIDSRAPSGTTVAVDTPATQVAGVTYDRDNTPTINGVAEAGSTVTIKDGTTLLGTTVADANGNYSFTPANNQALSDAVHALNVTATDAAGNVSTVVTQSVKIDTSSPTAPTATLASPALTTGAVQYDRDNTPTLSGVAEVGATVTIQDGTTVLGTTVADANGNYSFTPSDVNALSEGVHTLSVTATDAAGNVSPVASQSVKIDSQIAPPTVGVAAPGVTVAGVTYDQDNTPTLSGTAEAGSTVTVQDGATVLGTTVADASGNYAFTPSSNQALYEGPHTLQVTATDAAGNVSSVATQSITIDTLSPTPPSANFGSPAVTVDGVTYDKANIPTITGVAEAGSTVTVQDGATVLGTTVADASGNYAFTPTSALSDGVHALNVKATDLAGNVSTQASQTVTIDTAAPNVPTESASASATVTLAGVQYDQDSTPTLTGSAEAGSTVTIKDGTLVLGTTVADANGSYTFTPSVALSNGPHELNVTATDAAGNVSSIASHSVTIDTIAPDVPSQNLDSPAVTIAGVQYDKDSTPTLRGVAEAGSTVTLKDGTDVLGTTVADASGNFDFTPSSALTDGVHTLNVTATDIAGNVSHVSSQSVKIDTTAPSAPTQAFASPAVTAGGVTYDQDNTPTLTGVAEAGSTVTVKNGNTLLGTTLADASGNYAFTPTSALSEGVHALNVTATDLSGNVSTLATRSITIDTVAPNTPSASLGLPALTTAGVQYDKSNTPTVNGVAEAGSTVTVQDGDRVLGTTVAGSDGSYSFTPTDALSDGEHALNVTATDLAGNVSTAATQSVKIDSVAPNAPSQNLASPAVTVSGVKYDRDNTPTLSGVAEAGSTVTVKDGSTVLGTTVADASGNYSFTLSNTHALTEGIHTLNVTATDTAGNVSTVSAQAVTIDTQTATPTLSVDAPGVSVDGVTYDKDNTPTLTGVAEAGSTVTVKDGATVLGTTVADASGNYAFTPTSALSDGVHALNVTATDLAGNVSTQASQTVTIDTQIATPSVGLSAPALSVGGVTYDRDNTPTLTGVAEAGSTVTVKDGSTVLGTTVADASGNYSFTPSSNRALSEGNHTLQVTATDAAGNVSSVATQSVKIDTSAPATPTENWASPAVTTTSGVTYDRDNTPTLTGVAEAGSTVTVQDGATVLGTTVADASGNYAFTPTSALSDGVHDLNVTATDLAGNVSSQASQTVTIDTVAPNVPTESVSASATVTFQSVTYDTNRTPTITGTAEAGSTVTIKDGDNTLGSVTANAQGAYSFTVGNQLSGGAHSFSVTATDLAGNTSSASPVLAKNVVCYMSGTRLQTQDGWKLVEHLKAGDLIKTVSGKLQPVTWVGHSTIDCRRQDNKQHAYPVRIAQHAFGHQLPERDLYVSPLHSIYVEGVMIPVIHLVNGVTVTQDQRESLVTYYHVELPQHDAVYAEGLPAETYLDTSPENRHFFSLNNGDQKVFELGLQFPPCPEGTPVWQHIWNTQGYAPLTQSGPIVEAVKVMLMQRAQLVQEAQRLSA